MEKRIKSDLLSSQRIKRPAVEPLHKQRKLYIGIDVGSTSSDVVVLDNSAQVLIADYKRTMGKSLQTLYSQLEQIFKQINPADISLAAATGSIGRFVSRLLDISFINEVSAQAAAVSKLYPHYEQATIIEMGGQDSKLIFIFQNQDSGNLRDFALNSACAAGTGSFLDQQAERLGIDIDGQFGQLALQSNNVPRMAGRCSVFAKSDMIHLQQQATPNCDILAGLCLALARNLKSSLGSGRHFVKPVIFTGGVAANIGVVRAFEKVFELEKDELIIPEHHFFTGAIGAVLVAKKRSLDGHNHQIKLEKIAKHLAQRGSMLEQAPRRPALKTPALPPPKSIVHDSILKQADKPLNTYLGVDVGSISTNVAVIDEQKRVLAKVYLMTAGQPLEAVRRGLKIVGEKVAGKVKICAAATTGSGRYLTGDFIGADIVINEITAQAAGAAIVNPQVDTIFEIGGQDSKYISLQNGVVVDFEMNHACAAGTGSFLEEQAQRLDINIDRQFADLAFESKAPIKLGERCTVFMESDLLSYQQQDAKKSDLVAGLSYSIATNYLNRVVGRRKIGNNICFQGGTAYNKAVWAAFEKLTGKKIMVPEHHEVTGAIGAAAIAAEHINKVASEAGQVTKSKFRGFRNLISVEYTVESFTCEHCPNNCEIKKVKLSGSEPLYYGSRCDRYNLKKKNAKKEGLGLFEYRKQKMFEYAGLNHNQQHKTSGKTKIGIPMALIYWQLLPLFSQFFRSLGFEVVLSGKTNKKLIRMGVEAVAAQPCFPVKVAFGHIAELIEKKVDYIFLPSIVSMASDFPENRRNQLCPYVQSLPYQAETAFKERLGSSKILTVPIRMDQGGRLLQKGFIALGKKTGVSAARVRKALEKSLAAQKEFESNLVEKARVVLSNLRPEQKLFVIISRPYNGCDEGLNLRLCSKLADLGIEAIPMDMLDLAKAPLTDKSLHSYVYWSYGQKILRAAEIIKKDPRLFAIYLSNFGCGPDSFLLTFFKDIMNPKPCLQLELDEHSADAGLITRLEAFLESLKNYNTPKHTNDSTKTISPCISEVGHRRKLYIPYMSDCSYGVAACFRAYGQPAEVMPIADESTLLQGRQFTTGKECLPCAITIGDILKVTNAEGFDSSRTAFLMPGSSGPCRFGMYNCMQRLVLRYAGEPDIPVISPNQDESFYEEFVQYIGSSAKGKLMRDTWTATVGVDLLGKLIRKLRPFAKDQEQAKRLYGEALEKWIEAVEKRPNLSQMQSVGKAIAEKFSTLELDTTLRKPKIGIVGEIYVRNHPFANNNIIKQLENLGAACDLASLAEWIYYTNFTRAAEALRNRNFRNYVGNVTQNYFQHRIEKKLAEPFERLFGKLAEGNIQHVIKLAEPYLHHSFEGEAILSIGKIIEFHKQGCGGVLNVMPFGCMPSTIVSALTMQVSSDCNNMPILNLSFDGQEDPTLTTRLEAFVEQVRQKNTATVASVLTNSTFR